MKEVERLRAALYELEYVLEECPCNDPAYEYLCEEYGRLKKGIWELEHVD